MPPAQTVLQHHSGIEPGACILIGIAVSVLLVVYFIHILWCNNVNHLSYVLECDDAAIPHLSTQLIALTLPLIP